MALTQRLRRLIEESVGYGLALEGISAAEIARSQKTSLRERPGCCRLWTGQATFCRLPAPGRDGDVLVKIFGSKPRR
jgi:hypothetical protein